MKLNLGCGGDVRDGWMNIDLRSTNPLVLCASIDGPLPFEAGTCDEILAQDSFEHISRLRCREVLKYWIYLLRTGGKITIRCPDIEAQCKHLLSGLWDCFTFSKMMFGGQDYEGNAHFSGWTLDALVKEFESNGLKVVEAKRISGTATNDIDRSDNPNILVTGIKQ